MVRDFVPNGKVGAKDPLAAQDDLFKDANGLSFGNRHMSDLIALGWYYGKAPAKYAPEQMVFGGIYRNDEGLLPDAPGRIWFEADLNYYSGKRNGHRVLWSNDGLMFVTYNHYESFIEVIGG